MYESTAIVEYLDEKYPAPEAVSRRFAPARIARRMVQEVDQYYAVAMERMVDQILFTPQDKWDEDEITKGRDTVAQEMDMWESLLRGEYLAGELSAADFALYPLIALTFRMEKKKPDLEMRGMIGAKVTAWMKGIEALPYFQKTWPPHWK